MRTVSNRGLAMWLEIGDSSCLGFVHDSAVYILYIAAEVRTRVPFVVTLILYYISTLLMLYVDR